MRKGFERVKSAAEWNMWKVREVLADRSGANFIDSALKILMAVVIGALLLAGLYMLFKDTILPTLTQRIKDLFDYKG